MLYKVLLEHIQNFYQNLFIFPKIVQKRGIFIFAENRVHSIIVAAWKYSKPLHLLSTADSRKQTELKRTHKGNYVNFECHDSIKKYNSEIGGVDWYNMLMSL